MESKPKFKRFTAFQRRVMLAKQLVLDEVPTGRTLQAQLNRSTGSVTGETEEPIIDDEMQVDSEPITTEKTGHVEMRKL
jgi:hypothetical protein